MIMTDREKLVKLLCEASSLSVDAELFEDSSYAQQLEIEADFLITNGVTVQRWIPVTERLPEIQYHLKKGRNTYTRSVRVLCVCVQKSGKKMVKEGYCEWFSDYPEPCWKIPGTIDTVTHWMPLPEPPKEVE